MKGLKKLALVSAIAALPAGAMAMEALDDATLSAVTGQDGISMTINVDLEVDIGYEDTTGLGAGSIAENAGMLYMPGLTVDGIINVDIDVGATPQGVDGGVLQINVSLPDLTISNFELYVRGSGLDNVGDNPDFLLEQRNAADGFDRFDAVAADPGIAVLELGSITLNELDLSIQLGADAENLVEITSATLFDIEISNVVVRDTSSTGELTIAQMNISEVSLQGTSIGITEDALVISLPNASSRIAMMGVGLRETADITNANIIGNVFMDISSNGATSIAIRGR
jgi:hypothetical protein